MKANKFVLILCFLLPFILAAQEFKSLPTTPPTNDVEFQVGKTTAPNKTVARRTSIGELKDSIWIPYPTLVSGLVETNNAQVFRGKRVNETSGRVSYVDATGRRWTIDSLSSGGGGSITLPSTQIGFGSNLNTLTSDSTVKNITTYTMPFIGNNFTADVVKLGRNIGTAVPNSTGTLKTLYFQNKWNSPSNAVHPHIVFESPTNHSQSVPFAFVQQQSPHSVGLGAPTNNEVFMWGFNPASYAFTPSPSRVSAWYTIEPSWNNGGQKWVEYHQSINYGAGEKRLFTTEVKGVNTGNPTNSYQFLADDFFVSRLNEGNNKAYFSVSKGTDKNVSLLLTTRADTISQSMRLYVDDVTSSHVFEKFGTTSQGADLQFRNYKTIDFKRGSAGSSLLLFDSTANNVSSPFFLATGGMESPYYRFYGGYTGNKGIRVSNFRFISTSDALVDFFGGFNSGSSQTYTGEDNIGLGVNVGNGLTTGKRNIHFGSYAARFLGPGSGNIIIGANAYESTSSSYGATSKAIIIGDSAARSANVDLSNKLWVQNSSAATPLIGGDFNSRRVGINTIPSTNMFEVDASSQGNPIKLLGLQQGQITDSILTSLNGVTRQVHPSAFGINACKHGVSDLGTIGASSAGSATITYPTMSNPVITIALETATTISDLQNSGAYVSNKSATSAQVNFKNGTGLSIPTKINWHVCPSN